MSDYEELPCRRCGRVWKWAFDKKSVPYCPEGYGCAVAPKSCLEELVAINEELKAKLEKANRYNEALESLRPVWAQGWTDDSMAAQASGGAISAIWKMLDAKNQTQAVAKLKTVLDTFAELKGEKGE